MDNGQVDLAKWFKVHNRPLGLYARQLLDEEAAADAVQEAFCRLMQQKRRPDDVGAWLFRTVRNAAVSELRRRRTRVNHAPKLARSRPGWFQSSVVDELDAGAAQEALGGLAAEDGELIVMRIWGQMTYEQMASVTGAAVSTVRARYLAALEELRKKMVTS